jgi:hypothetical protein
MDVKEAIQNRRAYHSLTKVPIDTDLIRDLAKCAKTTVVERNYIFG